MEIKYMSEEDSTRIWLAYLSYRLFFIKKYELLNIKSFDLYEDILVININGKFEYYHWDYVSQKLGMSIAQENVFKPKRFILNVHEKNRNMWILDSTPEYVTYTESYYDNVIRCLNKGDGFYEDYVFACNLSLIE